MIYVEVMVKYGLDKFDLCFGFEFVDVIEYFKDILFWVF